MDNVLKIKKQELSQALRTLKEVLRKKNQNEIIRDAVIKRFEYTFESAWKTVKLFLRQAHGIDVFSPKDCWRELRKNTPFTDEETVLLLKMADDRNEIIHTYREEFAEELYGKIKVDYYKLLEKIYKII
ncbi:nucleotidyltransferase [Candidatus Kuenenbacteria bacterium CG11_big_fil_rev_8_21_14_0_20_37_9]|uniref:Nucleotidyltransferase n=2 Tax=Candidatus Kueneniibacteriota TaxID=1752740 RepID=A0A2M6XS98_9BACT|nr:MAG: hypothetical protein AUJ29_01615 [Candidatus Kuenenbacteria bacterium CG1_02_38_13]PIR05703.1 MAG: nucleotidyltransferase [Candidatus Kuenenbacteria bacterium CG11_big_fil_rev_8_21_14_0_20_37_9]PIU10507.1 MAG: nucleotidyltransferase [Candidatus Kuenenbacteria bacterium CG08_land_8_20_14_0_20_37_23]